MNRRTLVIVGGTVFLVLLIGGAFFYLLSRANPSVVTPPPQGSFPPPGNNSVIPPPGATPPIAIPPGNPALAKEVSQTPMIAPTLAKDGASLLFLHRSNGRIMKMNLEGGGEAVLTTTSVPGLFFGAWAGTKDKAILTYTDGALVKHFIEPIASGTPGTLLASDITSAAWSPDGESIAYLKKRANDTALIIATSKNQAPRTVATTPVPDFVVHWPTAGTIILTSRPSGLAPSLILKVSVSSGAFTQILSDRRGVTITPSPDGSFLLFSETSADGTLLQMSRYALKDGAILQVPLVTLPEKCAFSKNGKTLYCAVPVGLGKPMPDLWLRGEGLFADRLLAIDLGTNQVSLLPMPSKALDAVGLFLSLDGAALYAHNKTSGTLFRITLSSSATSSSLR